MEEAQHEYAITKYFENETKMHKDMHHMYESIWKNVSDSMRNKPFYSSAEWTVLGSETHDANADDECGFTNEPCVDKTTCVNAESNVECDDKYFWLWVWK